MFSNGDNGKPNWDGGTQDVAYYKSWLAVIEAALIATTSEQERVQPQLVRELEKAKATLDREIAR
ncbi:MAG: hypothetical protein AAFR82_01965 [Pseudomonadota bacterium]